MSEPKCPICGKPAVKKGERAFPFCSDRCQLVDLGKWLSSSYRVPVVDDESEPPKDDGGDRTLH